jgi:hypothetical protein
MGVKRSDFAIRDEKDAMLRAVNDVAKKYKRIDDAEWTLTASPQEVRAMLNKYSDALKEPMLKFFAGETMEQIAVEAHEAFMSAIESYLSTGRVFMSREISANLIESLRGQIVRNIEGFMTDMDASLYSRAMELKQAAAQGAVEAMAANLGLTQLKIESITKRTTGEATAKAWEGLTEKYGSRETVKYRDGKNYPLNTYLDGRANTTATDIHLATTEMDAAQGGIYTGIISKHGASDTCRIWEGKVIAFSSEARDLLAKQYPEAAQLKTLAEVRADKNSHIFKFNCRHTVTPYPIQFFSKKDAEQFIEFSAEAA